MSQQTYRLDLPQTVLDQIRQLAEHGNRPVEDVIAEGLTLLFDEALQQIEPSLLDEFTDLQLWMVVHTRLSPGDDTKMLTLIEAKKLGNLDSSVSADLDAMLHRLTHMNLLRSKALRLLKDRGYDVETYLDRES